MWNIFSIIVTVSLTVFFGFYVSYYALCTYYAHKEKVPIKTHFEEKELPRISIIIPVYNEAKVLASKFDSLGKLNDPRDKLEVVYVDGGSTDESEDMIRSHGRISGIEYKVVLQGARMGFNSAVRGGFSETTGDVIFITGAETQFDSEALRVTVQHFADETVGAVTGRQVISNVNDGFSPKLEVAYRSLYDFVREAESSMDSPFDIKGEISAARRTVCLHLVQNSIIESWVY
ncbi:glycosyltransferase [Candidatus Bathyarchaeota archaeon]|nr:glycosyltransferase [Candidatus Bathyarchaeota archaeon]